MQEIIKAKDYYKNKKKILNGIKNGLVFIYPTDTIYGIGCDATNDRAVTKIREAKKRDKKPFSVMAPSKEWISRNCTVNNLAKKWIKKLPGLYTLILKLKNRKAIARNVNLGSRKIGVRIPRNWSALIAKELNKPIISTSANITGETYMTSLKDLNHFVKERVDLIIYEGVKKARPSKIVDLTGEKAIVINR